MPYVTSGVIESYRFIITIDSQHFRMQLEGPLFVFIDHAMLLSTIENNESEENIFIALLNKLFGRLR